MQRPREHVTAKRTSVPELPEVLGIRGVDDNEPMELAKP